MAATKQIIILGGGLSGLSYLHYVRNFAAALKKGHLINKLILLEANDYMGGSIKTASFEDGVLHELGPRSIRTVGVRAQNTAVLLEQLGLADKIVTINDKSSAGRERFIYSNGQLHRLPLSIGKIFSKLPNSKVTLGSVLYKELFKAPKMDLDKYPDRDPPLYDFISHRFGVEAAENVLDPIMRGITAGDARKLSTRALFSDLLDKEQAYGSVIKGVFRPPVTKMPHDELFPHDVLESKLLDKFKKDRVMSYNFLTGLQTLPERLSNSLLNTNDDGLISIYNNTKVVSVEFNTDHEKPPCTVSVTTVDGDLVQIPASHIVSTIPSNALSRVLPDSMPVEYRNALDNITKIPHSPVGCVSVEYRNLKGQRPKVLNSFGLLTHSKADSKVLGIAFDSSMFPQIDRNVGSTRMTCMIGGSWYKEILGTDNLDQVSNSQLEQIALEEIRKILRIEDEPYRISTILWKTGIAQYLPGHKERLVQTRANIKKLSMPLTLLGQSYDGVAVNDVVFTARMAAYEFVKSL